jgi:hypothetical protein
VLVYEVKGLRLLRDLKRVGFETPGDPLHSCTEVRKRREGEGINMCELQIEYRGTSISGTKNSTDNLPA